MADRHKSLKNILFIHYSTIFLSSLFIIGFLLYNVSSRILIDTILNQSTKQLEILLLIMDDWKEMNQILSKAEEAMNSPLFLLSGNHLFYYPMQQHPLSVEISQAVREAQNKKIITVMGIRYLINFEDSEKTGLILVQLIPMETLIPFLHLLKKSLLFILLVIAIPIVILFRFIALNTINPLLRLVDIMGYIEQGQFSRRFIDHSTSETYLISRRINVMVDRMKSLNKDNLIIQKKQVDSEMKALQAQINPHFLFNTLNTIKSMALNNQTQSIADISTELAKMLRYGIYNLRQPVPVEAELQHVSAYLNIQSHRFGRGFTLTVECAPEIRRMRCMKLLLQPLAENAIKHAFHLKQSGRITISGEMIGGKLVLSLADDGEDISSDQLKYIIDKLEEDSSGEEHTGIGLKNIHQRIRMAYGSRYGVFPSSKPGEGFIVHLILPDLGYVPVTEEDEFL